MEKVKTADVCERCKFARNLSANWNEPDLVCIEDGTMPNNIGVTTLPYDDTAFMWESIHSVCANNVCVKYERRVTIKNYKKYFKKKGDTSCL